MKEQILKIIGQLQYEISLLEQSEADLTGVTIRTEELKGLVKKLTIPVVLESCKINRKGLCEYSDKLGFCPRCDTDAYSR